jgi:ABC-2 type transport system permease protein
MSMHLRRVYAIFIRYVYLIRTNAQRLVQIFVWATFDIILWGFITKYLGASGAASFGFVSTLLGAVMLWDFLSRAMQGVSTPFLEDVWARNLLNLFASPLTMGEYVAGLVAVSIFTSAIGLGVMFGLAFLFFGYSIVGLGLQLVPFVLTLFLSGVALGVLATSILLRLGPSAEWFIWPLPMILSPFVGVFYPVSTLPAWMQLVSHMLPPSYVFEGMRAALISGVFSASDMWLGLLLACVYVALSYAFFVRTYRKAVHSGAIARYSAESFQ